jgi:hypothetical protein
MLVWELILERDNSPKAEGYILIGGFNLFKRTLQNDLAEISMGIDFLSSLAREGRRNWCINLKLGLRA